MLAGIENATRGGISIDGQPMHDVPPHMRTVNMERKNYTIRPEKFEFAKTPHKDICGHAQGILTNPAYLGEHSRCHVKIEDVGALVAVSSENRDGGGSPFGEGTPVWQSGSDNAAVILRQQ